MTLRTDYSYGQKIDYKGEKCTIVSNPTFSDYVTVETSNGKFRRLKANLLFFDSLKERYSQWKEQNDKRILAFKEQGQYYDKQQQQHRAEYRNILSQMSLFDKESEEYANLYKQSWVERMSAVTAGNKAYSKYMSAFIAATDTHWC
ncbi:MAG: hypothetical protein E7Z92_03130 [Cyanobacteria bacterium SIG31]|nr:hypothetical protein [Cyanobacteria bacterium SIG31]